MRFKYTSSDFAYTYFYRDASYPEGLRSLLGYVSSMYPDVSVCVQDLALASEENDISDKERVEYLRYHLDEVMKGMRL